MVGISDGERYPGTCGLVRLVRETGMAPQSLVSRDYQTSGWRLSKPYGSFPYRWGYACGSGRCWLRQ